MFGFNLYIFLNVVKCLDSIYIFFECGKTCGFKNMFETIYFLDKIGGDIFQYGKMFGFNLYIFECGKMFGFKNMFETIYFLDKIGGDIFQYGKMFGFKCIF
jgi:hypothetical protein